MFNKEKALKLLVAIEEESKNIPEYNMFGENNYKEQYPIIIEYLKTGIIPDFINENYELLYSVIEDFDCVCADYGIK